MKTNHLNCGGLLILSALCLVGIGTLTALGKPVPEIFSWAAAGSLCGLLGLTPPGTVSAVVGTVGAVVGKATGGGDGGEPEPEEDPTQRKARQMLESMTPEALQILLPDLVPNVAAEVRRAAKKLGIRL